MIDKCYERRLPWSWDDGKAALRKQWEQARKAYRATK